MRYIIRADATINGGAGHVMRSSVIAEELILGKKEVIFVGETSEIPWVNKYINQLGFSEIIAKPEDFSPNSKSDFLVLDSYTVDYGDKFIAKRNWKSVMAFVDNSTPKYSADLYVHAGPETHWGKPINFQNGTLVTGKKFIPIRRELCEIKEKRIGYSHVISSKSPIRILISGGGSDPFNFSIELCKILSKLNFEFTAQVLASSFAIEKLDYRFEIIALGSNLSEILQTTDLVFTTAGTSSWEYIYLGFPIGLACAVANQKINYKYQTENELVIGIAEKIDANWQFDLVQISNLISNAQIRKNLRQRSDKFLDSKGSKRIIQAFLSLNL